MSIQKQYQGFLCSKSILDTSFFFEQLLLNVKKPFTIPETSAINTTANEVLGKRIERFFEYFIDSTQQFQIIGKNLQIFRNKITIGEIDFLIKDIYTEQITHIEFVYKFYIYDPSIDNELDKWIGPNKKDSLVQKVEKLKTKQLPLLYEKETVSILKTMGLEVQKINQQVCFLGNLFIPYGSKKQHFSQINNQCIVGFWITLDLFTKENYASHLFYLPDKKDWIIDPKHNTTWHPYVDILESIKTSLVYKKSPLLWMKTNDQLCKRFFVVWW